MLQQSCEYEHTVQFYEEDQFLVDAVGEFIGSGLDVGQAAIIILTPSHRQLLEAKLRVRGIDLQQAEERGQYVALDAADTLARFMVNDDIDEKRFAEVVGGVFARVGSRYSRVRAFGEMVALLWADQKPEATIRLEKLWNNFGRLHPFSLLCAYPINAFIKESAGSHFRSICSEHMRVVPLSNLY
jgi:hypothetical protein